MGTLNELLQAWREQKRSKKIQAILCGTLPLSAGFAVVARDVIERHVGTPNVYTLLAPLLVLVLWVPLFVALYRSVVRESAEEKQEMERRHRAEDELLFSRR